VADDGTVTGVVRPASATEPVLVGVVPGAIAPTPARGLPGLADVESLRLDPDGDWAYGLVVDRELADGQDPPVLVSVELTGGERTEVTVCDDADDLVLTGGGAVVLAHDELCLVGPAR
jgi:hypothetical protein